jgi:hypothetical protein
VQDSNVPSVPILVPPPPMPPPPPPAVVAALKAKGFRITSQGILSDAKYSDGLREAKKLRKEGVFTEDEFQREKAVLEKDCEGRLYASGIMEAFINILTPPSSVLDLRRRVKGLRGGENEGMGGGGGAAGGEAGGMMHGVSMNAEQVLAPLRRGRGRPAAAVKAPRNKMCEHMREKRRCKQCLLTAGGGSSFCKHNRLKYGCVECGGAGVCEHKRQRRKCSDCRGAGLSLSPSLPPSLPPPLSPPPPSWNCCTTL